MSGEGVAAAAAFGEQLRRCRRASGLTQEELAERAGVGVRTLRDLERGQRTRPYRRTVGSLADALGLREQEREAFVGLARHGWRQITQAGLTSARELDDSHLVMQTVPRQLPAAVSCFTGRTAELEALTELLGSGSGTSAVVISALAGTAGVGKTAVAVQWAHQFAGRFPDGQLYVNLRGYDPGQPVTAGDALGRFLRALGLPGSQVPTDDEERATCYRSLLAGRRMLILLDNAADADQVRPLLPGTPGSVTVVTSRDALAGLVARDGARRLDLDVLPALDAVGLLHALIGARVDTEPEAAAAMAAYCCRLPLALRVAAELAAARPEVSLASLAAELARQQGRLDLLTAGGDVRTDVRAVFSWSLRHLDLSVVRAFRLVGVHPGRDLDSLAVAALTGTTAKQAGHLLDQLSRAHLIHSPVPSRYAMHDLLADCARELAAEDGTDEQRAALTRLFDHYLLSAGVAMQTLFPAESGQRPELPTQAAASATWLRDEDAARAWLAAELPSLVAAVAHAAAHDWPQHAIGLAATIFRYLDPGGHLTEAVIVHESAANAARQMGDVAAEARALSNLAAAELRQSRDQDATAHLLQAQALSHQAGDRDGEARALGNLGVLAFWQGRHAQAAERYEQAMRLHRQSGNRTGEITGLCNLAGVRIQLNQYDEASAHLRTALAASREIGHQDGAAYALVTLGDLSLRQGHDLQARPYLQEGLALCRLVGDRAGEAAALSGLGELALRQRRYETAGRHLHRALALSRMAGARSSETDALHLLGELSLATGDDKQARNYHAEALALSTLSSDTRLQARAHQALARADRVSPSDRPPADSGRAGHGQAMPSL